MFFNKSRLLIIPGSATFFAPRIGLFWRRALNKIQKVWHMQIYYNSSVIMALFQWEMLRSVRIMV